MDEQTDRQLDNVGLVTQHRQRTSFWPRRLSLAIILLFSVAVLTTLSVLFYRERYAARSPVPQAIRQTVGFDVYYPDQKKLPPGYKLDLDSFKMPQAGVVLYAVSYDGGQKLVFSVQQKPSDSDIQSFYAHYMPLHSPFQSALGQAQLGAYGQGKTLKSVVSLSITNGPWIIVTAPANANQDQLKQAVRSLTK